MASLKTAKKLAVLPPDAGADTPQIYYPDSDGEPMAETQEQWFAITYMVWALTNWFREVLDVHVGGDQFIYYLRGSPTHVIAPDVYVVFGAVGKHRRRSWRVWEENGALPGFIMEIGSPSTWQDDATSKRDTYAGLGVQEYWRFDPLGGELFKPVLIGERLVDGEYRPIETTTDEVGILRGYSRILGLDICVRPDGEIRLYDPTGGEWLLSHEEALAENRRLRELLAQFRPTDKPRA